METEDLKNTYGIDVGDEMVRILSEEIAKSIDKDILRGLGLEPEVNKRRKNTIRKIFYID